MSDLAEYLARQRWFRDKSRAIATAEIVDAIPVGGDGAILAFVSVTYLDGTAGEYLLVLRDGEGTKDALVQPQVAGALLDAFDASLELRGDRHVVRFRATSAFASARAAGASPETRGSWPSLTARASGAEQTNTSVVFGDALVLKLLRCVETGASPELEMGAFLTAAGYEGTPATAGWIEVEPLGSAREPRSRERDASDANHTSGNGGNGGNGDEVPATLGLLHRFVPNQGDAWAFTLAALARSTDPATYRDHARRMGARTAEMHRALASPRTATTPLPPAFAVERFDTEEQLRLVREARRSFEATLAVLDERRDTLDDAARATCDALLGARPAIHERIDAFARTALASARTRVHGDLHLGQLLVTPDDDFVIVDFEGEPARPMAERRRKRSPIADVAGLMRSFHYAAVTAGAPPSWHGEAARNLLDGYTASIGDAPSFPRDPAELAALIDFYVLEKAIYELGYEVANRPSWVAVPAAGLLAGLPE